MNRGFYYAWAGILLACGFAVALMGRALRQADSAAAEVNLATHRKEQARQRLILAERKLAEAERERGPKPGGGSTLTERSSATFPAVATVARKEAAGPDVRATKLGMRDGKIRPEVAEAIDPGLRDLYLRAFAAQVEGVWGPVLQQLALPQEKEAALKALLLAHEERRLDVTAVAGEQQLELDDPVIQKLRSADGARFAREVLDLLGPDDGKIFQQYRRNLTVMAQINGIAVTTYTTNTPLTYAESRELQTILAAHSERMANGFVRPNSINWDAALAEIAGRGVFSPSTVEALRHQAADADLHRQLNQRKAEIGATIMGHPRTDMWVPNFPALQPRQWTGSATIPKPH